MLGCPEDLFDGPELLVAKHRDQRVEIGVGTQHEHTVEPGVFIGLVAIDGKVAVTHGLEEPAIAGIAHQSLIAPLQLSLQSGKDRSAIGGVFLRLLVG